MRWTRTFIHTLRQDPGDAEVVSHRLMARACCISKVAAGIYNYLPLGWRSLLKLEAVIRDELEGAGSTELHMPAVQPAELWQESGRWAKYGKRAAPDQGPPRPRVLLRADPRGGDHRRRPAGGDLLPAAAGEPVPDPDQVPGRDPAPLRPHARPRVPDEGRLLLPRFCREPRRHVPRVRARLPAGVRALRPVLHHGRGRHRQHRRLRVARVHGPGRHRRGRDHRLSGLRLRRQRREGDHRRHPPGADLVRTAAGRRRRRSTPPTSRASPKSPRSSARPVALDQDHGLRDRRGVRRRPGARRRRGQRGQAQERPRLPPPPARLAGQDRAGHRRARWASRVRSACRACASSPTRGDAPRRRRHRRQPGRHPPGRRGAGPRLHPRRRPRPAPGPRRRPLPALRPEPWSRTAASR